MLTLVESSWSRLLLVWSRGIRLSQCTVVGLLSLMGGAVLSAAWMMGDGAAHTLVALAALGTVAILLVVSARADEPAAGDGCGARKTLDERAQLAARAVDLQLPPDKPDRQTVEMHDAVLRRIGAELHDGPAQLISLALLRLDGLLVGESGSAEAHPPEDIERVRGALQEALAEIRSVSMGLAGPELHGVATADVLRLVVRNHERRTGTSVACDIEELPRDVGAPVKSCIYRFVQEALNNTYRHAHGRGQSLRARRHSDAIEVEVADTGPGFDPATTAISGRLGLLGMRERIAALGGTLEIDSRLGTGTRLIARFNAAHCNDSRG